MQNVEDRNLVLFLPVYNPDFGRFPEKLATIDVVKSPASLDWWPSSTEYGHIMQIAGAAAGEITNVVIRYGGSDLAVPATVQLGSSVELHAFGKLSASSPPTKCGMNCQVRRPDGTSFGGKYDMTTKQNPGQTLRFSIVNISVNQGGSWLAIIQYYTLE